MGGKASTKLANSKHNAALFTVEPGPSSMIHADATSASGPARCRTAPLGVQRQRDASRYEAQPMRGRIVGRLGTMEDPMKRLTVSFGVIVLLCVAAISARAQSHELLQGTQEHLRLLTGLTTAVAKSGDPFVAEVAQPVYLGSQIILPAGARVKGQVGGVIHPRLFAIFRGQAAMNLAFRDLEIDSRVFPAKMSILSLQNPSSGDKVGKSRKDVKVEEGQVVQAKHDIKGDVLAGTIGTGGGTLVGAVFSHVARGFGIGLIGSTAYILSRKGKEVDLPAQTVITVRMDNTITLPRISADNGVLSPSRTLEQ